MIACIKTEVPLCHIFRGSCQKVLTAVACKLLQELELVSGFLSDSRSFMTFMTSQVQILCSSKLLHIPSPLSQPVSASSASCKRLPSIKRMLSSMACKSWSHRACTWQETSKDTLQTDIKKHKYLWRHPQKTSSLLPFVASYAQVRPTGSPASGSTSSDMASTGFDVTKTWLV